MRQVVLFVHLMAAMFWIGEMLMIGLVLGPISRSLGAEERSRLFQAVGRRSLPLAWIAIGTLIVTGILNLYYMNISFGMLVTPAFYRSPFGMDLDIKLLAVLAMLVVSVVHDFYVARRNSELRRQVAAANEPPGDLLVAQQRMRTLASRLGRLNMLLALIVLFCAAGLVVFGG